MSSVIGLLVVLAVIIFVHEFGHFITAKAFGMRVFIFSFGFGKRLAGFKWGDTDCRLSAIPLGGYVKLEGEADDVVSEDTSARGDGRDFTARPRWQRFAVYLAGPIMNAALTVAGFTTLFMQGWSPDGPLQDRPVIGWVEPGSPAAGAGLAPADEIVAIDGQPKSTWEEAQIGILLRPDRDVRLTVRNSEGTREVRVRPRTEGPEKVGAIGVTPLVRIGALTAGQPAEAAGLKTGDGLLSIDGQPLRSFEDLVTAVRGAGERPLQVRVLRDGKPIDIAVTPSGGRIGVASSGGLARPLGFLAAVDRALRQTWRSTVQTLAMLRDLLTARVSPRASLTGPIGIAKLSGEAVRTSPAAVIYVITMISLSVGILNLFPLPPLDGGHLAILLGEGVIRRDFSVEVKSWIMNAGAMALFLLIGLVLYSDISKMTWPGWLSKYLP
jgi:regulator of sigma E protease